MHENIRIIGVDNLNSYYDPALKTARLRNVEAGANESTKGSFEFIRGDIADANFVDDVFSASQFDVVVNLAAQAGVRYSLENPRAYVDSNMMGFFNILDASRRQQISHLVYASSSSVYGNTDEIPYSESQKTDSPVSLYAATKKANELMAYTYSHLYRLPTTGLRFFTVYGPYGRPDMAYFSFAEKMRQGKPIQLFNNGDMWRDFTYIDDVVAALVKIILTPPAQRAEAVPSRVYNIGNNSPVKLEEFVDTLENCLREECIISSPVIREYLPMQQGDVYQTYADVEALARDYDFRPNTPLAEGLSRFAKWYKKYTEGAM